MIVESSIEIAAPPSKVREVVRIELSSNFEQKEGAHARSILLTAAQLRSIIKVAHGLYQATRTRGQFQISTITPTRR